MRTSSSNRHKRNLSSQKLSRPAASIVMYGRRHSPGSVHSNDSEPWGYPEAIRSSPSPPEAMRRMASPPHHHHHPADYYAMHSPPFPPPYAMYPPPYGAMPSPVPPFRGYGAPHAAPSRHIMIAPATHARPPPEAASASQEITPNSRTRHSSSRSSPEGKGGARSKSGDITAARRPRSLPVAKQPGTFPLDRLCIFGAGWRVQKFGQLNP